VKAVKYCRYMLDQIVKILAEIGEEARAVEPLTELLKKDPSSSVRSDAAQALGQIGDGCAVEPPYRKHSKTQILMCDVRLPGPCVAAGTDVLWYH
jgi:hypothetical protein